MRVAGKRPFSQPQWRGLVARVPAAGGRLAATDRGLAMLARRDRIAVGLIRKRWSPAPLDAGVEGIWRDVRGRNSRQLLCNLEHTPAVRGFATALAQQARDLGWKVVQLDPPRQGVAVLPPRRRAALRPSRRLRHPPPRRCHPALLPRVGTARGAALDDGGAARALPALLRLPPPHRRPRCPPRRPRRPSRRDRCEPLPARGAARDGTCQG